MKRFLIYSILILIIGVFSFEALNDEAGYVIVSYAEHTYEMTLWFCIICLVIFGSLLWFSLRTAFKFYDYMAASFSWLAETQSKNAARRTGEGLVHFLEGNWREAKRNLLSAVKHSETPLVHYLAAAQSAYQLGDREEWRRLLSQAEKHAPQNSLAVTLSQARLYISEKRYQLAVDALLALPIQRRQHPVALELLSQAYWHMANWQALVDMLPALRKANNMGPQQYEAFEKSLFVKFLNDIARKEEDALATYQQAWKKVPKHLQIDDNLLEQHVEFLLQQKQDDSAEKLLRSHLKRQWSSKLAELYGRISSTNSRDQMYNAEKWLQDHPDDPALLSTLGRFCARNQLWGKAKDYFERSLSQWERPQVYAEYARLCGQLGEHKKSAELYERGLLLTTS